MTASIYLSLTSSSTIDRCSIVLCADEPTSGLDSFTAITVIESLHRLTRESGSGRRSQATVICSIHQPRADVFHKFDAVLILSKGGHAVFCGTTDSLINYFSDLGYRCPDTSNPADYFVDLSSIELKKGHGEGKDDVDDDIEVSVSRVNRLITSFKEYQGGQQQTVTEYLQKHPHISTIDSISTKTSSKSFKNSWFIQVRGCYI